MLFLLRFSRIAGVDAFHLFIYSVNLVNFHRSVIVDFYYFVNIFIAFWEEQIH